jgi:hypothetical protein
MKSKRTLTFDPIEIVIETPEELIALDEILAYFITLNNNNPINNRFAEYADRFHSLTQLYLHG